MNWTFKSAAEVIYIVLIVPLLIFCFHRFIIVILNV